MPREGFPSSIHELEERLAGASAPTEDDQSRSLDGEPIDNREALERFLADVERARADKQSA